MISTTTLLRCIPLGIAFLGYAMYLRVKWDIDKHIVPAVMAASLMLMMYIAGILNFMPLMTYAIVAFGVMLAGRLLIKDKVIPEFSVTMLILLALVGYVAWFTYGGVYADGDSTTHWGVVVREIIETNRLPNFTNVDIVYTSYPTGTAGFVYFFCKFFGYSEAMTLFAQGILVLACGYALFSLVNRKSIIQHVLAVLFVLFLLQFNIVLDDLRVDNVLSALCFAGIVIAFRYADEPRRAILRLCPLVCSIVIVKNSGAIFVLLILAVSLCLITQRPKSERKGLYKTTVIFLIVLPLFTYLIWDWHTKLVFLNSAASRHALSFSAMLDIYASKSQKELGTIFNRFFMIWFSFDKRINASMEWSAITVLVFVLLSGRLYKRFALKTKSTLERNLLLASIFSFLVFKVLLLCTYLFNMPGSDALGIASYTRYNNSVVLVLYGITVVYLYFIARTIDFSLSKRNITRWFLALFVIACLLVPQWHGYSYLAFKNLTPPNYRTNGLYRQLTTLKREYNLPERNGRILVFTENPYSQFFVYYCFRSYNSLSKFPLPDEKATTVDSLVAMLDNQPGFYDYLLIIDYDEQLIDELEKRGYPTDQQVVKLK